MLEFNASKRTIVLEILQELINNDLFVFNNQQETL